MTGRSLRATPEGIQRLRKAIKLNDWKQSELKDELGLKTRHSITKVLAGQPIERSTFEELCHLLGLPVEEIAASESEQTAQFTDIDALVQDIREQIRPLIQECCGTMRVLDMTQPIELEGERGIYTNVNILEKLTGRRRLEIAELLQQCDSAEFEHFGLSRITETRIPGLDAVERYSKLMVLGKPGAGKTTFLKYLAMQCISGRFLADHVPLFVTLKRFAETKGEPDLLDYVCDELLQTKLDVLQCLIDAGKIFFLLDGLDEVREEDTSRVIEQIQGLANRFQQNQFVITCRIAAKDYTFERFTEVEVADFNDEQIQTFAQNWFRAKGDADRATQFIEKLEANKRIKELATSPLLLTLLCLMFEDTTSFPANRAELYKEGLDILLKKWDGKRKIEREQVYKNLSLKRKEDLLSQIALTTFENKEYFFKQRTLEDYITDFIRNLPDAKTDPEALHLDSEAVLKSIEAHHGLLVERAKGIYSFSHLTFHEYFAAREIVESRDPEALQRLASHITEPRWREVFLLIASMMRNADELVQLMKQEIDQLLAGDEMLQQVLVWVQEKSTSVSIPHKSAVVRVFYLALDLNLAFDLDAIFALAQARTFVRTFDVALDFALTSVLTYARVLDRGLNLNAFNLALAGALDLHPRFEHKLRELKDQLLDTSWENRESFQQWWQANGQNWTEQLRAVMIEHRNIGHDWKFTDKEKDKLQQYYDANKLLVDCLNSDCYVSREVRAEIEETLLLPMSEVEKRRK
jgi:predicted NACHT family NTPase